jgi:hypothetical protein|tara:strand:- start:314 stop:595 length:282 start_codon:yes stop_codon:yes gene_type:complete
MEEEKEVTKPEVVFETIINENLLEVLEVITENPILVKEKRGKKMDTYNKLEWLTFAIQESINGNHGELENALMVVEDLREPYLKKKREKNNAL